MSLIQERKANIQKILRNGRDTEHMTPAKGLGHGNTKQSTNKSEQQQNYCLKTVSREIFEREI